MPPGGPAPGPWACWALVVLACGLDWLLGDPPPWPHPVVVMGRLIAGLRRRAEVWAGFHPGRLQLAGGAITLLLLSLSGGSGWLLERLALAGWRAGGIVAIAATGPLLLGLASALAGRSLEQAVQGVLAMLPADATPDDPGQLEAARRRLAWIVGRDTEQLGRAEILRAAAETASENAVDGLFAPLFWMLMGAGLWALGLTLGPGPLTLAWVFKAASTLDSMLGYRRGRLRWLGCPGARCDDALVWLPCRLVALCLPLLSPPWQLWPPLQRLRLALREGQSDPSPNAGLSQAIYAHACRLRMGGINRYRGTNKAKPVLGGEYPPADAAAIGRILRINRELELFWLLVAGAGTALLSAQ